MYFNQLYSHAHCQLQHISDTGVVDILFRFIFCIFLGDFSIFFCAVQDTRCFHFI